jgi:hypothetical protein
VSRSRSAVVILASPKTGSARGEKIPLRLAERYGHHDRDWETRAGAVEQRIPELRKGSCFPGFLKPRHMDEKALTAVAEEPPEAASAQWRSVADQTRPKVPNLATITDEAEADALAT